MTFGITGNPKKERLWEPVAALVSWLLRRERSFCLHKHIAQGLSERELVGPTVSETHSGNLTEKADVILSFGGDGTMLRTAHEVGANGTPILGINIGRLGFLADVEVGRVQEAIEQIEKGAYNVEARMVLEASAEGGPELAARWALNEFVLDRSGSAGLLRIEVTADGTPLNTYWADGLIMATPTGSTAYSLSAGGPIIAPGCDAMILTPIAPHTLTVRPIVLPGASVISARICADGHDGQLYVLAADGRSTVFEEHNVRFTIRRAPHTVNLVKLPDRHYFQTLRSKLMWGAYRAGEEQNDAQESETTDS